MAQMTTLLNVVNSPQREVITVGYPSESPTLPLLGLLVAFRGSRFGHTNYADTTSKKAVKTAKACCSIKWTVTIPQQGVEGHTGSLLSTIIADSAMQMQKVPRKMYHRSKLSWLRMCVMKRPSTHPSFAHACRGQATSPRMCLTHGC